MKKIRVQTNGIHTGHQVAVLVTVLPPLLQEGCVLPGHNTRRIDHYLVSIEALTHVGLTRNSSPYKSFSGFRKCRFEPRTRRYIDIEISGQTLSPC